MNSGSAPIGNHPPPQGFHHQPQHDVHVQGDHHQLPESPAAQPVIPHVSCLHLKQQKEQAKKREDPIDLLTLTWVYFFSQNGLKPDMCQLDT